MLALEPQDKLFQKALLLLVTLVFVILLVAHKCEKKSDLKVHLFLRIHEAKLSLFGISL